MQSKVRSPQAGSWPRDWLVPQWPAPAGVRAVMTTCAGGVSKGLFGRMNLGDHVGDEQAAVAANRAKLAELIAARPVFMRQVHGTAVARVDAHSADLQADGALTQQAGVACTVMVADCLPVLLTHQRVPVVAALHAGWRGLAGQGDPGFNGVVESGWAELQAATGLSDKALSAGLMAWLGPCIGPEVFEVGAEVREAFVAGQPEARACFKPLAKDKFLADLPQLARLRLQRLGIQHIGGNDGSRAWCTVSESAFFSHRRVSGRPGALAGDTGGRMAACIWLA
jgi:YfiH family protein